MKKIAILLFVFVLGVGGTYSFIYYKRSTKASTKVAPGDCTKHKLKACPFCDKSQIEAQGECKAHEVAEALCHVCRPELVAAFKLDGDWCGGHEVPESQCQLCGGGPVVRKNGEVLCNKHKVPGKSCPFCDKSLIESMGMCGGHKVPEALCTRCNADLIPGFKAEGDWCAGHNLPESQCKQCGAGQ